MTPATPPRLPLPLLLLLLAPMLHACKPIPGYAGTDRQTLATYRFRTLTADLPAEVRVPAAVAAARAALIARGYTITAAESSEDVGRVTAETFNPDPLESVVVSVRQRRWDLTRLEVRVEPTGDQVRSRAILDAILAQLGR